MMMKTVFAGIDYSMSSPALTLHCSENDSPDWSYKNCEFHFFHNPKKGCFKDLVKESPQLSPYEYPKDLDPGMERFSFLSTWILKALLSKFESGGGDKIDIVVWIEGYSYGSTGSRIFEIGENGGILKYHLFQKGIPFKVVPPTTVKKFYTGSGRADKQAMEHQFISETGMDLRTTLNLTQKQSSPVGDICDSYAICKYGFHHSSPSGQ